MRFLLILSLLLLSNSSIVQAQSYSNITIRNIRNYLDFQDHLKENSDTSYKNLKKTKDLYDNLQYGLNIFFDNTTYEEVSFSWYLRWVSTMDLAKKLVEWKSYENCIKVLAPLMEWIKSNTLSFSTSFVYLGKTYQFDATQMYYVRDYGDYYIGYSQFKLGKDREAFQSFYRFFKSNPVPINEGYQARKAMLEMHKRSPNIISRDWYFNSILFSIIYYDKLNAKLQIEEDKNNATNNQIFQLNKNEQANLGYVPRGNLFRWTREIIQEAESANPEPRIFEYCANIAPILEKYDSSGKLPLKLYQICYQYYRIHAWMNLEIPFKDVFNISRYQTNVSLFAQSIRDKDPVNAKILGMDATNYRVKYFSKNYHTGLMICDSYEQAARDFDFWGEPALAKEYRDMVKPCLKENKKKSR